MINSMHIKNIERKIKDYNENLTLFDQQFVIVPYLASGYIDYSNFGQVSQQRLIDNYETYKRLWTGNDSFTITWKDSVSYANTNTDSAIKMNYKIGDAILGWLEMSGNSSEISTDSSFNEYKSQIVERSLTFRINANEFQLDTNFELMFFKVPELSKNVLYRVESLDKEYLGKDLICYTLSLKALNQDLANTGRAKQQNVMPNSPGQGYYDVAVVKDYVPQSNEVEGIDYKPFFDRYLVADKAKMFNNPVKKVVVKAFGLCAFSNITFWGRRVTAGNDFRNFGIPRIIFPINFTNASTYTLYRTQNEETNYYWIEKLSPIIMFNTDTFSALKGLLETNWIWPQQGFAKILDYANSDHGVQTMKNTNPITPDANNRGNRYKYQLFGEVVYTGTGNSSYQPWNITISGTNSQVYTDITYGCAQKYTVSGTKVIHDAMFDAYWTQKQMKTLPISPWNTLGFGWTIGAAFAASVARNFYSAAALMLLGIGGNLIQKAQAPVFQGFSCMVPASLMDFMVDECSSTFGTNFNNQIKLSYFDSYDRNNDITQFFNTQTMNTSFEADLTDLIIDKQNNVYQTTCIGQTTYENGNYIFTNQKPLLMDGSYKLKKIEDENEGFIIDSFNIQALFKGDYSIEFLDKQGTVIWSGIFQSQGKWTSSIREINTWVNTSIYGRENMFLAQPLPWPKTPSELNLVGITAPVIDLNFNNTQYAFTLEITKANTGLVAMQEVFENKLGLIYLNNSGNTVGFQAVNKKLENYNKIVIKSVWNNTLQEFINQYGTMNVNFGIYTTENSVIYHTLENLNVSTLSYADFSVVSVPGGNQSFSMSLLQATQGVGNYLEIKYPARFNNTQNWRFEYSFVLENNQILLEYWLYWNPTTYQYYEWMDGKYNRWSSTAWDTWKLYNRPVALSTRFNDSTNIKFGSFINQVVVKPKVK